MATTINAGRVRFVSRGTYNNSTQYYLFDLVDYNGSSYIAKENTLGNLPTNTQYWQLIAEKGNTGNTGQTGPVGPTGNGILSITKTGTSGLVDTYTITYTNGNTTTFTITNGEDGEVTETELDVLRQKVANQQKVIDQLPQVKGQGTSITLENTIEAQFTKFEIEGNSTQDGTPSPDYPSEVKSCGDNGSINEVICNKNLFDKDNAIKEYELDGTTGKIMSNRLYFTSDYIRVNPNEQYYLSGKNTGNSNCFYNKDKKFIAKINLENGLLTVPDDLNIYYLRFNSRLTAIDTTMLEKNTKQSAYEEHQEQSYIIPTQQPMRSIGDVRDLFFKNTVDSPYYDSTLALNGWYERHYSTEFVAPSSKWKLESSGRFLITKLNLGISLKTPLTTGSILKNKCTHYIEETASRTWGKNQGFSIDNSGNINIYDTTYSSNNDLDGFQNFLSNNDVRIVALLENPTDLPCTQAQIDVLENMPSTYKEMTIINSEDETEAYLEVSGIYDLNNLINN